MKNLNELKAVQPIVIEIENVDYIETVEIITKEGILERVPATMTNLLFPIGRDRDCYVERFVLFFDIEEEGEAYRDCECLICDKAIGAKVREAVDNQEFVVTLDLRQENFCFTTAETAIYSHHESHNEMSPIRSIFNVAKYQFNHFNITQVYDDHDEYADGFVTPAAAECKCGKCIIDSVPFATIGEGFIKYHTHYSNNAYWHKREFGITEAGQLVVFDYEDEDDENLFGARLYRYAELYQ